MEKHFNHQALEPLYVQRWRDLFNTNSNGHETPYTIMMPPPNVTGRLHIGHALSFTLQDILIRYHRLRGRRVLWQAGVDHAGISTEMMVDRHLRAQGLTRNELGREKFISKVWEWKEEYGSIIIEQLQQLGASADWSRKRFTMDEGLSRAVTKVFVDLYNDGLIYRSKRLVNWDVAMQTALSDLEVQNREEEGFLWYISYEIEGGGGTGEEEDDYLPVATTRPETIPGDMAIAVHPEDARYKHLIGRRVRVPLSDRFIPIIADYMADPEKGSGAVKITPAHDFRDYEVGLRHNLPQESIIDTDCCLIASSLVPAPLHGLERMQAREKILEMLACDRAIEQIQKITHTLPYSDRTGVLLEPLLTDQWFVDARKLAGPALAAVKNKETEFVPSGWESVYFQWLKNIQPWCISRQIWWGHRVPAWYGPDDRIFVAMSEEEAASMALQHYGRETELRQDTDVLDTWFSSALWPFGTLGWPKETADLVHYYPSDVLVTGFDIIFFWVARMMMMSIYFMGKAPFKKVYIHPLVRDVHGQKMSKTKGNVIDPLQLMEEYGTDALRFGLAALAAPVRDIKLNKAHLASQRNFITKIWNAARYILMQLENTGLTRQELWSNSAEVIANITSELELPVNRWMVGQIKLLHDQVVQEIEAYNFNNLSRFLYQGVWNIFCDWYLEFTKPIFISQEKQLHKQETIKTLLWCWRNLLVMLHPIIPFVTEELWQQMGYRQDKIDLEAAREMHAKSDSVPKYWLSLSEWPRLDSIKIDQTAVMQMNWVKQLITEVRSIRNTLRVPNGAALSLIPEEIGENRKNWLAQNQEIVERMANLRCDFSLLADNKPFERPSVVPSVTTSVATSEGIVKVLVNNDVFGLVVGDSIDLASETLRLQKDHTKLINEIKQIEARLNNQEFVNKAAEEVVEETKIRLAQLQENEEKLKHFLVPR